MTRPFDIALDNFINEHDEEFKALVRTLPDAPKDTGKLFRRAVDAILTTPLWMPPTVPGGQKMKRTLRDVWPEKPTPALWGYLLLVAKELTAMAFGPKTVSTVSTGRLNRTRKCLSNALHDLGDHAVPWLNEGGEKVQTFDLGLGGEIILTAENIQRTLERAILFIDCQVKDQRVSLTNRRTRCFASALRNLAGHLHMHATQNRTPGRISDGATTAAIAFMLKSLTGVPADEDVIRKALTRKKTHL